MTLKGLLKSLATEKSCRVPLPGIDTSPVTEATIEENIRYLEWLMSWYCQRPSLFIANVIVARLEALRMQEQNGETARDGWSCKRLVQNWQYIAERQRARS